ncbi:MAG: tetratricopeptide repeat protein, partial [Gemmatimonadota bacterium]
HQKAGLRDAAAKLYQETLENDFGLYMAHVRLAEIHEAHQSWTPAITERRLAVEANPEDFSLRLDLAITQAKGGRVDDAMLEFEQAAVMQPRDPRPHYFMGLLHQMKNAQEEARGSLTEFLALAPARFAPQIRDAQNRLETLR